MGKNLRTRELSPHKVYVFGKSAMITCLWWDDNLFTIWDCKQSSFFCRVNLYVLFLRPSTTAVFLRPSTTAVFLRPSTTAVFFCKSTLLKPKKKIVCIHIIIFISCFSLKKILNCNQRYQFYDFGHKSTPFLTACVSVFTTSGHFLVFCVQHRLTQTNYLYSVTS